MTSILPLVKNGRNNLCGFHANEALIETLVGEGKFLVIDAKRVEKRGVEIAHVHFVDDYLVPDFIGLGVVKAALGSAARHPEGKGVGIVITGWLGSFSENRMSPKLTTPDRRRAT